jgi:hypothetical protein
VRHASPLPKVRNPRSTQVPDRTDSVHVVVPPEKARKRLFTTIARPEAQPSLL